MATKTRSPLSALTESQLKAVQVAIKHDLKFDLREQTNWRQEWEPGYADIVWPVDKGKASEEFSLALTGKKWNVSTRASARFAFSLLKKGVLAPLAVLTPEHVDERTKKSYRATRYTISNEVREASGSIGVALDQLQAKEEASVARENAWDAARTPLDKEARDISNREHDIKRSLSEKVKEHTPDGLIEAHRQWHELVAELESLNVRLKAVAAEHKRKYEPYTLRGW